MFERLAHAAGSQRREARSWSARRSRRLISTSCPSSWRGSIHFRAASEMGQRTLFTRKISGLAIAALFVTMVSFYGWARLVPHLVTSVNGEPLGHFPAGIHAQDLN